MKFVTILVALIAALIALGWFGRRIQPASFPVYSQRTPEIETIPLPTGLPAPVERFYRQRYGDRIPVIKSAVLDGRAMMRPVGPFAFPARFRFTYIAGQGYRHYIETTFFGLPVIKADEHYLDGKARMDITLIGSDEGEKVDQAANLGLWAESLFFPSVYLTDPRVHWEPVDDATAILVVPLKDQQQRFVVRFDPDTGSIVWFESMRYHSSTSMSKVLWLNQQLAPLPNSDGAIGARGAVTWMDDGKPWFVMTIEDAVYNVDVQDYIRAKGL